MKINIAIASASINVENDAGEVVYSATVEGYQATILPGELAASIAAAAEQISTSIAEMTAKLEAL